MIEMLAATAGTSVLAVASTVHLALLLLRHHRNPSGVRHDLLLVPSLVLCATPWMFSSVLGLAVGFAVHLGWFVACELLTVGHAAVPTAPASTPAPSTRPAPAAGPAPPPARPSGFVRTPVLAVIPETPDITTIRMARPEGFDFAAGQFLTVRIQVDGRPVVRCYSISSAPEATGYLEISVKRQGLVSGWLHSTVRAGSTLAVRPPAGAFVYPAGDDRPVVLLAGGVGITPLVSMLRHAVAADPERRMTLLYSVATHRDVAFRSELRALADRHPQVRVLVTATRGPHSTEHLSGRIDRRMLTEQVEDLQQSLFMICGPGPMIDGMRALLGELGVAPDSVRAEAFEAAVAAANAPTPSTEPRPQASSPSSSPAVAAGGFRLHLVGSDRVVDLPSGCTLLEACEGAGVELPSACRAGVCGTCRTRLVDGDVACEGDAGESGWILPCVSTAQSDCAIEA